MRLLDWLPKYHRAKPRKDFEQGNRWHDQINAPLLREYKRQPEDIERNCRNQSASQANQDRLAELMIAAQAIKYRHSSQQQHRWNKDQQREHPHWAQVIEIK